MNRAVRRQVNKQAKGQAKQKYTLLEVQKAFSIALEMKRESKGHLFSKTLKDRCMFCGKTPRVKKECEFWFVTYLDRVQTILINPEFFIGVDQEAYWLQHGTEYDEIRIPMLKVTDG